jgi:protein TonB
VVQAALATGPGGTSSPFAWALAASVALHAALIAGLPDLWTYSPAPATAPLNARIEPGTPGGEAPARQETVPAKPPAAATPQPRRAPETPSRRATRSAAVAPLPVTPAEAPSPPAEKQVEDPPAQPVAAAAGGAGEGGASGEPTLAPRAGEEAIDYGSLAQYRLALIGTAKRHRLYPAYAVERGWHGRVAVRLAIGADGGLAAAQVRASSGHKVLDGQALEMLTKAAELTPLPPALRHREFTVDVPVVFELVAER